jgi:hypothetical protein
VTMSFQITKSIVVMVHGWHDVKVRCHAKTKHLGRRLQEVGMGWYDWR